MGVQLQKSDFSQVLARCARTSANYLAVLALLLAISAGSAWSFEQESPANVVTPQEASALTTHKPSPTVVDSCLPLLKSLHHTPVSTMDRNQRSAGKAAALGIVFGVRFALGPKETATSNRSPKARLDIWQDTSTAGNDRHALAIADYRNCQKEKALQALSDFRWQR